jgi:hypothetical protein
MDDGCKAFFELNGIRLTSHANKIDSDSVCCSLFLLRPLLEEKKRQAMVSDKGSAMLKAVADLSLIGTRR